MDELLAESLARTLRSARRSRGLSLDQLVLRAKVSKRVLVAIENAVANPNLATLARIANALGMSVSALVEQPTTPLVRTTDAAACELMWRGSAGGTARLILTTPTRAPVELWRWRLFPGEVCHREPHPCGAVETITVIAGDAAIIITGTKHVLTSGITATFTASVAHSYLGQEPDGAELLITVHLPAPGR